MTSLHPVQFGKLVLREKSIAEEYGRYAVTLKRSGSASHDGWATLSADAASSYGHFPYEEAGADDLDRVYPQLPYQLHHKAAESFRKMAEAAAKDGVTLGLASAFRNHHRQGQLFHGEAQKRGITLEERAKVCAPPGFSEHHTGYTVDLKDNTPGVNQKGLEETFENTPAFQWMIENGHRFGWVLSFPRGNRQGVSYEPWHWHWESDETSRKIFARARRFNEEQNLAKREGDASIKTMRTMRKVNAHAIAQLEKTGLDVVIGGEGQWLKDDPHSTYYSHYEPALTVALVRRDNRELLAMHRETIESLKEPTAGPYKLLSTMLSYAWSVVDLDGNKPKPGPTRNADAFIKVSSRGKPGK